MTAILNWAPLRFLWNVWLRASREHLGLIAAGVAFFCVFALFPALAALIALFGLWADPLLVSQQLELLEEVIPSGAYELIYDQIMRLITTQPDRLGWATVFSSLIALWSARAGVGALTEGLNAIQGTVPRSGVFHILAALALTLALVVIVGVACLALLVVPIVMSFFVIPAQLAWIIDLLRWAVALCGVLFALGLLYRYGPRVDEGDRISWFSPGAIAAVVLWLISSAAFTVYVGNFGRYNEVYGSIGAVIALMMWLYISAYLVLLGAAVNYQLADHLAAPQE